jgi:hypothetical protein
MSSAVGEPIPGYALGGGNPAYAVPTEGTDGPGYHDSPVTAYAPKLSDIPGGTPDPMRLQGMPSRDYRPDPAHAPDNFWTGLHGPGRERQDRHRAEFLDADGIEARLPVKATQARNPREIPPSEPRWTNRLSPHNYVFTRPFGQETERYLTGDHFSMADHRRTYAILGMNPPMYRRSTYRADPVPWDSDIIDRPSPQTSQAPGRIIAYDLPPMSNSSWRL